MLGAVEALGGGWEVADIDDDVVDVGQVEVDEVGDLGLLGHDLGIGVDEERAGQRVLAGIDGFGGGIDAFDGEIAQLAGVLLEVGVAEVADGVFVAADALDEDVVILGELEVAGARGWLFAFALFGGGILDEDRVHDGFDEVVEGAGVGAGAEALDRLGRARRG